MLKPARILPPPDNLLGYRDVRTTRAGCYLLMLPILDNLLPYFGQYGVQVRTKELLRQVSSIREMLAEQRMYAQEWINDLPPDNLEFHEEPCFQMRICRAHVFLQREKASSRFDNGLGLCILLPYACEAYADLEVDPTRR
jgi:hypothetical protein